MQALNNQTIRFFVYDEELDFNDDPDPIKEVKEAEFKAFNGVIVYERNTMFNNGVNQVCLTKYPEWMMEV